MTDDSIFSSSTGELRWVRHVSQFLEKDTIIEIEKLARVPQVPKSIFDTKPEAYTPQVVGLGPYQHWRRELYYKMERHKIEAAKKVLEPLQLQNFRQLVVDKLKGAEPIIRACYDKHLEHDFEVLAWMLAIDGLYLINFFEDYRSLPSCNREAVDPELRKLVQDLFLLENQIPVHVLKEIRKAIGKSNGDDDPILLKQLLNVCRAHSPLLLNGRSKFGIDATTHILSYMHSLIVQNRGIEILDGMAMVSGASCPGRRRAIKKQLNYVADITIGPVVGPVIWFIDMMKALFGQDGQGQDVVDPKEEKIRIPSVTQLSKTAKIDFKPAKGGIRDVELQVVGKEHIFHLPVIQLHADSEVILRNLVAYEVATTTTPGKALEFAEYVDLMCGIIDTPKDVQLLRDAKIIKGSLGDEEIATLFNGITKLTAIGSMSSGNKSSVARAVDQANQIYDNKRRVKVSRFFKEKLTSKTFLSVMLIIILVSLLAVQAFCQIYGCSSRWFGNS